MNNKCTLLERILQIISQNNIQNYLLSQTVTNSEELFFIKKELQLYRNKSTTKCNVTIYQDFEHEGKPMRGSSSFIADISMTDTELENKIQSAYHSALSVKNPYYQLPMGQQMFTSSATTTDTTLLTMCKTYNALELSEMLFKHDIHTNVFINSAEIFVTHKNVHIINSNGVDVSYSDVDYSGEYVVQAIEPNDVELYYDFRYSYLDKNIPASIEQKLKNSLIAVQDRANAKSIANNEIQLQYDKVILEGSCVYDLFYYYLRRLDASMIYPGYSKFSLNNPVISNNETLMNNDKINISLIPTEPYSSEGIRLIKSTLVKDNIVKLITGDARFSHYLGIPAIGTYDSYEMRCGNTSLEQFKTIPHLRIVNFSDFQMNELTGQFGGEYRLAYYFDGTKCIPVTNGSISGNINELVKTMQLSKESQDSYHFHGPLAVAYTV